MFVYKTAMYGADANSNLIFTHKEKPHKTIESAIREMHNNVGWLVDLGYQLSGMRHARVMEDDHYEVRMVKGGEVRMVATWPEYRTPLSYVH